MRHCLCLWVLNGNRPATVWVFCADGLTHMYKGNLQVLDNTRESGMKGFRHGRGHTVADRAVNPSVLDKPSWRGSNAIIFKCLNWRDFIFLQGFTNNQELSQNMYFNSRSKPLIKSLKIHLRLIKCHILIVSSTVMLLYKSLHGAKTTFVQVFAVHVIHILWFIKSFQKFPQKPVFVWAWIKMLWLTQTYHHWGQNGDHLLTQHSAAN